MCGIVGFLGEHKDAKSIIENMTNALIHRGPDEQGIYSKGMAHLGHTRLSVIDLAAGAQPLENEDGTIWTVFNGEIYNYKELRAELLALGHIFKTNTDTEVIIHGYEEYGENIVNRLRGMFAFAIWSEKENRLFVTRDPFGIKPFYYSLTDKFFVFASELKAIMKFDGVSKEIDLESIALFLERQFIPSPRTIYKDIKKLRPGYAAILKFDNGVKLLKEYQYCKIDYSEKFALGENELIQTVENSLIDSVKSMLVSDVPLGVFLSGGIDSSLIAALTAKELPN
ncbi:MAG: Asparagine synthetase, partial [Pseudomonadota bacterium]